MPLDKLFSVCYKLFQMSKEQKDAVNRSGFQVRMMTRWEKLESILFDWRFSGRQELRDLITTPPTIAARNKEQFNFLLRQGATETIK